MEQRNAADVRIRPLRETEHEVLREFLYQCIFLPEGREPPPRDCIDAPELSVYIDGFGKVPGDVCAVAEVQGTIVGAAWARVMHDYGHIGNVTPSLAISVLPEWRGRGIGTVLLDAVLQSVKEEGYEAVSLSVQKANRAQHLYRRHGFRTVADRGEELIMVRTFL